MAEGVLMPKAGITVEECVITEWLKKPGDQVAVGDILFTYETDKATFECESTAAGTLLEIFYNDGDEVPVLVNVCAIGKPGDSVAGLKEGTAAPAAAPVAEAAPAPAGAKNVQAPMPGTIVSVKVSQGQAVTKDTVVAILEAMKMENEIYAGVDGTVASIAVAAGQSINTGDTIVSIN